MFNIFRQPRQTNLQTNRQTNLADLRHPAVQIPNFPGAYPQVRAIHLTLMLEY